MIGGAFDRRPRILNAMHALGLCSPRSGTAAEELECLARHASGKRVAIEIGTHMGVSAVAIAEVMDPAGILYCIDPWPRRRWLEDPSFSICRRELSRRGHLERVRFVRRFSRDAAGVVPDDADFMFIDGDHSREGIATDWALARAKVRIGGVVCLHDTWVNDAAVEQLESVAYFRGTIMNDADFTPVERCRTLNVMLRCS